MDGLDLRASVREPAADLHQAADVAGDDGIHPLVLHRRELPVEHGHGDLRLLDREGPAEPTARIAGRALDQLAALDLVEELAWFFLDAQVAQTVTGVVPLQPSSVAGSGSSYVLGYLDDQSCLKFKTPSLSLIDVF